VARPWVGIDLAKVEHNARAVTALCARHGIAVTGVTKATGGLPEVAQAMLRGGCVSIGESRMENVARLRAGGVAAPVLLLRIPPLSAVDEVVAGVEASLNSELAVLRGLSEAALRQGRVHPVIVMVDLGDLREGVWPDDVVPFAAGLQRLAGVRLVGLGANLTCYGGVVPTEQNMGRLVRCAEEVEQACGLRLAWLSAGSSSALPLVAADRMPARVNHLRIGEAILLGRETLHRSAWPGTFQDAFLLHAELIELKEKPSLPIGERAEDAFGQRPDFADRGEGDRALLDVGREDVVVEGLTPVDGRLRILGASSDYLIVDASGAASEIRSGRLRVGSELTFAMNYAALLAAMSSSHVEKRQVGWPEAGRRSPGEARR
jgi:predicted amino acid racemase